MRRPSAPFALVLAAALAYPVAVVSGGLPRFPSRSECVDRATKDADIEAVFGRFDRRSEAALKLRRVLGLGFKSSQIERDACGRLKVVLHGIPTLAVGRDFVAEAHRVDIDVTLEYAAP
jgi:hypothetical protein